jgi:hypothetical protein
MDLGPVIGTAQVHAFDAWQAREQAPFEAGSGPTDLPCLLRLTPADREPRLIGSSLHLLAGAAELERCELRADSGMALELALPGPREGSVWLQTGNAGVLRLRIAFQDRLEICADSSGTAGAGSSDTADPD